MEFLMLIFILTILVIFIIKINSENLKEKLLEALVDNLPNMAVTIIDENYTVIYTGGEEVHKLGYNLEKLTGKHFLESYGEEMYSNLEPYFKKVLNTKKSINFTYEYLSEENEIIYYYQQIIPVHNSSLGNKIYCILLSQNITNIVSKDQDIEQKNKVLLEVAWIASHKIMGPIKRIAGLSELVDKDLLDEDNKTYFNYIVKENQNLNDIVSKIVIKTDDIDNFDKYYKNPNLN